MRVIDLPGSLDFQTYDALLAEVNEAGGEKLLFDGRHLRWVGPNGMVNLLAAGSVARDRSGEAPHLELADAGDVKSYLSRMGFFQAAETVFDLGPTPHKRSVGESDVLLEITPITTNSDVHEVVDRVQKRAGAILSKTLGYPMTSVVQFSVILSEVCQNVIEHAEAPGWVAAQSYNWSKRAGDSADPEAGPTLGRTHLHPQRYGTHRGCARVVRLAAPGRGSIRLSRNPDQHHSAGANRR